MNTEITSSIHYVGVNDRHKHIFEGLWPLPYGVSYNSYIIDDEKVALIDTVEVDFFPQFLANIRSVIGDRPIDYIFSPTTPERRVTASATFTSSPS